MFPFGQSENDKRIKELEKQIAFIRQQTTNLEVALEKKTTDYEQEAKEASIRAIESAGAADQSKNAILGYAEDGLNKLNELIERYNSFDGLKTQFDEYLNNARNSSTSIQEILSEVSSARENITTKRQDLEEIFSAQSGLEEKVSRLQEIAARGDDIDLRTSGLLKNISDRKKEVEALYYEIMGSVNEEGEVEVDGLKAKLEASYTRIETDLLSLENTINDFEQSHKGSYDSFVTDKKNEYTTLTNQWSEEHRRIVEEINKLLPNALTAGLSAAYHEKKVTEVDEYKQLSKTFTNAIYALAAVSLIPIAVSVISIFQKITLEQAILRIPRLVLAILPLYIPVLWVAYSANKKRNLSKRLIEEYSHKETLSKTFEGLSKQINNIEDMNVSSDLKVKLLYNIVEVNSENPGKLISDYNKSDHPLMDALDKSIKLTNAVTKLSNIPGFNKLATSLSKKTETLLNKESEKAEKGLEMIDGKQEEK